MIELNSRKLIGREQQLAEKIHAYTLPRSAANSRVKDLVELALLIGSGELDEFVEEVLAQRTEK